MCKKLTFEIGDTIIIKHNLKQFEDGINKNLPSNLTFAFTSIMEEYEGAVGEIVKCEPMGYVVDFDESSTILSRTIIWPSIALKQCFSINSYIKSTTGYPVMMIKDITLTPTNRLYYESENGYQWFENEVELASYSEYLDYRNLLKEANEKQTPKNTNNFMDLIKETLDKIDTETKYAVNEITKTLGKECNQKEKSENVSASDNFKEEKENKDTEDKQWVESVRSLIDKIEFFSKTEDNGEIFYTSMTFRDGTDSILTSIPMEDDLSLAAFSTIGVISGLLVWITGRNPYLKDLVSELAATGLANLF